MRYNKNIIDFELACGFQVTNEYRNELRNLEVKLIELPEKKNVLAYMASIRKIVSKGDYDFVYIHGNSAMMIFEALSSKIGGGRVITHCHNTKSDYPMIHYLSKPLFNMVVDAKIGCSSLASKWAYSGKRIYTITNGVDIERFTFNSVDRAEIRNELGWQSNIVVGHIGRFIDQKNHEKLINIFAAYHAMHHDARLLLIGDGELRLEVERLIAKGGLSNEVKIIQHTTFPEKYMSAMDIMVIPSLFEGLCLVAVEAQANGLPTLIDEFFSEETAASDNVKVLKLSDTNQKWAKEISAMLQIGRKNVRNQLKDNGMDYSIMMKQIQEVLLGE